MPEFLLTLNHYDLLLLPLTSSQGGWHRFEWNCCRASYFNSHPHEEDDTLLTCQIPHTEYFNSHPHKEDDIERGERSMAVIISTHILTRRMTESYCYVLFVVSISTHILTRRMTWKATVSSLLQFDISTHILTRRMTTAGVNLIFQLAFQLTSSQGGWRGNFSFGSDQLKLFQLTSSRGGWQDYLLCLQKQQKFQLTSSRGGWRAAGGNRQSQERFQLTSSRGGWLHPFPMLQNHQHFNSHPHEEDDYDSVL